MVTSSRLRAENSEVDYIVAAREKVDDGDAKAWFTAVTNIYYGMVSRPMPIEMVEHMLDLLVSQPVVQYEPGTRRYASVTETRCSSLRRPLAETLALLGKWSSLTSIAVDGQTGAGKSSFLERLYGREMQKVNMVAADITKGSDYNWLPLLTTDYALTQVMTTVTGPVCWDRSPYSNLAFAMVHWLMDIYTHREIPFDHREPWYHLTVFATRTNLLYSVSYLNAACNTKVLFLVNSLADLSAESMMYRGIYKNSPNDVFNATRRYTLAQYHAFCFMAEILGPTNALVIDIAQMLALSYSFDSFQTILAEQLAWMGEPHTSTDPAAIPPNRDGTIELYNHLGRTNQMTSLIRHSKK
jgi:hypothetical protein